MLREGRSYEVDFYEAVDFIQTRATEWDIENKQLFRGVQDSDNIPFSIIEPSSHERKAVALSDNVYNIMIDNLPSWDKYPKRHNSVYGSFLDKIKKPKDYINWIEEEFEYNDFGYVNFLIPEDGAMLAVCDSSDLRISFSNGVWIGELPNLFKYMNVDFYDDKLEFDNWSSMEKVMKEISLEKLEMKLAELHDWEDKHHTYGKLIKSMKSENSESFYEYCNDVYAPTKNDIELIEYTKNNIYRLKIEGSGDSREIWTEADCLLVNPKMMSDILEELNR